MKIQDLKRLAPYIGDYSSIFGMKAYSFSEGRAAGMRAIDLKNGKGIEMTVLIDRCLDIPYLSFRGCNIGFCSKTGISGPWFYQEDGSRGFLKQFNAGFLTTGGITYAGAAHEENGRRYGLHGVIGNTPAENVNKEVVEKDGQLMLRVSAAVREACVFEENILLSREIILETESNTIQIHDRVSNQGFEREPLMNVYHMNFGYPMLSEACRVYIGASYMKPRDGEAEKGIAMYDRMEVPRAGYKEQCFFHTCRQEGDTFALLHNEEKKLAVVISYNAKQCPILCQWKCMMAGDYALGMEPTASGVMGKSQSMKDETLQWIEPGEERCFDFKVEILDDENRIKEFILKSKTI